MMVRICSALALLVCAAAAAAEVPPLGMNLIKDMNAAEEPAASAPTDFFVVGDKAYFTAYRPESGVELFVTDGTEDGSKPFADLLPGESSSSPAVIGVAGDKLILRAGEYTNRQIWSVALSNGAARQVTAVPRPVGEPEHWTYAFASTANRLLFRRGDDAAVWSTDGTQSGTFRLLADADFALQYAVNGCSGEQQVILAGGVGAGFDSAIVATDGTSAGSRTLAGFTNMASRVALRSGGFCYFLFGAASGARWELWRSDGTVTGTVRIAQDDGYAYELVALGDSLYIGETTTAQDHSRVVRVSAAEPALVPIAEFTGANNYCYGLHTVEGKLLFFQRSASESESLYLSDGTVAGTRKVFPVLPGQQFRTNDLFDVPGAVIINEWTDRLRLDLNSGEMTAGPRATDFSLEHQARLGSRLVGQGYSEPHGGELWHSDGTAAGTRMLKDFYAPTAGAFQAARWTLVDDVLVVAGLLEPAPQSASRWGLFRSDGTAQGTYALPRSAYDEHSVYDVVPFGDGVAFQSLGRNGESTIYRTSTALTGTSPLVPATGGYALQSFAGASRLLFGCNGLFPDVHLCSYAAQAGSLAVGPAGVEFDGLMPVGHVGSVALFRTLGDQHLWRSDGTAPGTFMLASWGAPAYAVTVQFGGKLYFHGCSQGACGLVASDGTLAGTSKLVDTTGEVEIREMAALPGYVVFMRRREGRSELWSTDGTAAGAQFLAVADGYSSPIAVVGGKAHVFVACNGCANVYVVSDGTSAGTRRVDLPPGVSLTQPFMTRLDDDVALFGCTTADRGAELCAMDAAGDHVALLPEIVPGSASPYDLFSFGTNSQGLFFSADDRVHGRELWFLRKLPDTIFEDAFEAIGLRTP